MKKYLLLLPVLLAGLLAGCTTDDPNPTPSPEPTPTPTPTPGPVHVSSISLNTKTLTLDEGTSETLTYTISPSNAEDKSVIWESSDAIVASVENGVVKAWNPGTADISVTTVDGNKKDVCKVTVNKKIPEKSLVKDEFALNEQGYDFTGQKSLTNSPLSYMGYTLSFAVGGNTYNNQPTLIKAKNNRYEARVYWGNTMTVTSATNTLAKIEFDLGENDAGNAMTCSVGEIVDGAWVGESKEVTFTVGGTSGYKAFETFRFCYEGQSEDDPEVFVNLGMKTISEVKNYIEENPVKKNAFGNGVNEKRLVTIQGFALAKIDLEKFTSKFGLDVSEHGKVIMADNSGFIGCATAVNNQGTCLWGKIANNTCKPTSKYIVTGYLSEYLGHPEILVQSFVWDEKLDITLDISKVTTGVKTLTEFYSAAENLNYNCAGHAYGDVITIKDLKCYYVESDGQGKRYYNFTDGSKNIRVNAFNLTSGATEGKVYDVTGVISLKNLSPIIVAFEITSSNATVNFDYETAASEISISSLKAIHGSQDDVATRFPEVISSYGNFYKIKGYVIGATKGAGLYVGLSDTPKDEFFSNFTTEIKDKNVILFKNNDMWNTDVDDIANYYPTLNDEYLCESKEITIYCIPRQLEYCEGKAIWQVLLVPEFLSQFHK